MNFDFLRNNKMLNRVKLTGVIIENPKGVEHRDSSSTNRGYFETKIAVQRKSGYTDEIVLIIEETPYNKEISKKGNIVSVEGYKNSKNKVIEGKNRLLIYVSVKNIEIKDKGFLEAENKINPNVVELEGIICKPPVFRQTPQGRYISDAIIAIARPYPSNKTDYIPVIGWGSVAERMSLLKVGNKILIKGRIQSREYEKKITNESGEILERKIAYEVSINEFSLVV